MKMDQYLADKAKNDPCISVRNKDGGIKPFYVLQGEIVARVLPLVSGCMSAVAKTLGVRRSTLYRWKHERTIPNHIG